VSTPVEILNWEEIESKHGVRFLAQAVAHVAESFDHVGGEGLDDDPEWDQP